MCDCARRHFLQMSVISLGALGAIGLGGAALAAEPEPAKTAKVFICPPCGCDNDGKDFPAAGPCTACGMPLIEKPPAKPAGGLTP
jgi:hypothetical protein